MDFYCPKLRLAIEVDGDQHAEGDHVQYDQERELYLKGLDIATIRFWNKEVRTDIEAVLKRIHEVVLELQTLPAPLASRGETEI